MCLNMEVQSTRQTLITKELPSLKISHQSIHTIRTQVQTASKRYHQNISIRTNNKMISLSLLNAQELPKIKLRKLTKRFSMTIKKRRRRKKYTNIKYNKHQFQKNSQRQKLIPSMTILLNNQLQRLKWKKKKGNKLRNKTKNQRNKITSSQKNSRHLILRTRASR